jgi:hypothetical protein
MSIREARIIFKAGKNRDGFFDADDLLRQVDKAIDIFKGLTKGWAQGLFLFDNAPSHQKRALDALSARNMVKGVSTLSVSLHHHYQCPQWVVFVLADPKSQQRQNTDVPTMQHYHIRLQALCRCIRGEPFRTHEHFGDALGLGCLRCMRGQCADVPQLSGAPANFSHRAEERVVAPV